MEAERMISANIQARIAGQPPEYVGFFKFFVLPRVGENLRVKDAGQERLFKVVAVDHTGYSDEEPTVEVGSTIITCEELH